MTSKAVVSISLDLDILEKLKKESGLKQISRSKFTQNILRDYFNEPKEKKDPESENWLKWD